jgi:hypothetical protein
MVYIFIARSRYLAFEINDPSGTVVPLVEGGADIEV